MSQTKTAPAATTTDVDSLNSLLRGEISAVDTYEQALRKFDAPEEAATAKALKQIRDEHSQAVGVLTDRVKGLGGKPSEGAGVWGVFAGTVTAGAKLIGPVTAMAALKQGEEHGIAQYEKTLENKELSTEGNYLIQSDLLPRCRKHVAALNTLIAALELKTSS